MSFSMIIVAVRAALLDMLRRIGGSFPWWEPQRAQRIDIVGHHSATGPKPTVRQRAVSRRPYRGVPLRDTRGGEEPPRASSLSPPPWPSPRRLRPPKTTRLAKKLANPVSDMISVPFQYNYNDGYGPQDGHQRYANVQRVWPVSISENWNLIRAQSSRSSASPTWRRAPARNSDSATPPRSCSRPKKPGPGGVIWGSGRRFYGPPPPTTNSGPASGAWGQPSCCSSRRAPGRSGSWATRSGPMPGTKTGLTSATPSWSPS